MFIKCGRLPQQAYAQQAGRLGVFTPSALRLLSLSRVTLMTPHNATMTTTKLDVFLWSPYVIGQTIYIFILKFLSSSFFYSSPNLSRRRLDVYHTSTHGVALVRI